MDKAQKTTFGLLRHAQTEWNSQKLIQGHKDSPLSTEGVLQAQAWGKILQNQRWSQILASDLGRVRETVEQIQPFLNLPVQFDPMLREQNWGLWTGKSLHELESKHAKELAEQVQQGWDFCPPGGETRYTVYQRASQALLEAAINWPNENILVVCHEGVLKALIYKLANRNFLPDEPTLLKKPALHLLSSSHGQLDLEKVNFTTFTATA